MSQCKTDLKIIDLENESNEERPHLLEWAVEQNPVRKYEIIDEKQQTKNATEMLQDVNMLQINICKLSVESLILVKCLPRTGFVSLMMKKTTVYRQGTSKWR